MVHIVEFYLLNIFDKIQINEIRNDDIIIDEILFNQLLLEIIKI